MSKRRYTDEQQASARNEYNLLADELAEVFAALTEASRVEWKVRRQRRKRFFRHYYYRSDPTVKNIKFHGEWCTRRELWNRRSELQKKLGNLQGRYHLCTILRKGFSSTYRKVRRAL